MIGPDEMHVIAQLEDRMDELEDKVKQLEYYNMVAGMQMSLAFRLASLLSVSALDQGADTNAETVADIRAIATKIADLTDILGDGGDADGDKDSD